MGFVREHRSRCALFCRGRTVVSQATKIKTRKESQKINKGKITLFARDYWLNDICLLR